MGRSFVLWIRSLADIVTDQQAAVRIGFGQSAIRAKVYKSANQVIGASASGNVSFDSESSDEFGLHDNTANNHRLSCGPTQAGTYDITMRCQFSGRSGTTQVGLALGNGGALNQVLQTHDFKDGAAAGEFTLHLTQALTEGLFIYAFYITQAASGITLEGGAEYNTSLSAVQTPN
jgi:hypothetical protein